MRIRTKKLVSPHRLVRIEGGGEIKEIVINEDFLHTENASVALYFRGKHSSGIVDLSVKEIESIMQQVSPKLEAFKGTKVIKFRK